MQYVNSGHLCNYGGHRQMPNDHNAAKISQKVAEMVAKQPECCLNGPKSS